MTRAQDQDQLSLNEIENFDFGDPPEDATHLVATVHRVRRKPVGELDAEDLRVLLLQKMSPETLIPRALTLLEQDPQVAGNYYEGDLLVATLHAHAAYWRDHPQQAARVEPIITAFGELDPEDETHDLVREAIDGFRHGAF